MGERTASADPLKLEAAAQAIPEDVRRDLTGAHVRLTEMIEDFAKLEQSPEPLVSPSVVEATGIEQVMIHANELDTRLAQVAQAFRAAGGDRSPGFVGPVQPGLLFLDDAALETEMGRWSDPEELAFRKRDDGGYDVQGPDGRWYIMRDTPPWGAVPHGQAEQIVDFGNPDLGLVNAAALTFGLTGGTTQKTSSAAPPAAYEYVSFDENGYPVATPDVHGHSQAPRAPAPTPFKDGYDQVHGPYFKDGGVYHSSVRKGDAGALLQNGLAEYLKHSDAEHAGVNRVQTTFYIDPETGERVAVVDAARVFYDNQSGDAIVESGRLSVNEEGEPVIIDRPIGTREHPTSEQPNMGPAGDIRIPAEEQD